jgi:hypothetical protein
MPDTRVEYAVGKAIPGFQAGQGRMNQTKGRTPTIGEYTWDIHATIESFDTVGSGPNAKRKVKDFHVSLYSDGQRWGGFYWSYSSGSYSGGKYKGSNKSQFGDATALAALLKTATAVAQGHKAKFGANIVAASW